MSRGKKSDTAAKKERKLASLGDSPMHTDLDRFVGTFSFIVLS